MKDAGGVSDLFMSGCGTVLEDADHRGEGGEGGARGERGERGERESNSVCVWERGWGGPLNAAACPQPSVPADPRSNVHA